MTTVFGFDVDGVLLDLHTEWLRRYNQSYGDSMSSDEILGWDIHKFVVPECGKKIYDYLNFEIYDQVYPLPGALEMVQRARYFGRVVFITTPTDNSFGARYHCLMRHGFFDGVKRPIADYYETGDKSLVGADWLIDDCADNCEKFGRTRSIVFDRPWNRSYSSFPFRAYGPNDILLERLFAGA